MYALRVDSNGNLFAGGDFDNADGIQAKGIAMWDGDQWRSLGSGVARSEPGDVAEVHAIVLHDDQVFVGGFFDIAGGRPVNGVAVWDGRRWSPLGEGVRGGDAPRVRSMAASSQGIFVGGNFQRAGNLSAPGLAIWDGADWRVPWLDTTGLDSVAALALTATGVLYVGGDFVTINGQPMNFAARWFGDQWAPVGNAVDGEVLAVSANESDVYIGGRFDRAGGVATSNIARWDGDRWWTLNAGIAGPVHAIEIFPDRRVFAGGNFSSAGANAANQIAVWDGVTWAPLGQCH